VLNGLPVDPNALLLAQQMPGAPAMTPQVPGAPPVAPDASGQAAIVPFTSTTVRGPSTDTRSETARTLPTEQIKAAEVKVATAADSGRKAEEARIARDVKVEGIEADSAQKEADILANAARERDALKAQSDRMIAEGMAEAKAARQDLAGTKQGSYLDDMSMPRRFLTALSLGLGTYASAYGVQNSAMEIFKSNEAAYRAKKEAELKNKAQRVLDATGNIQAARNIWIDGQVDINNRVMVQRDVLKAQTMAQTKRVPQAAMSGQKVLAQLDKDNAADELKQANLFALKTSSGSTTQGAQTSTTTVEGTKPGEAGPKMPGMSDAEAKKAMYGTQILDAVKKIKTLPDPSDEDLRKFNRNAMGMRAAAENSTKGLSGPLRVAALRAFGVSPESLVEGIKDPRVQETLLNYAVAGGLIIRDQSGAAITNAEDINNAMQRLPQAGEARQVKRSKLDAVEKNGQLMLQLAGPGAAARLALPVPGTPAAAPAPAPAPAPAATQAAPRNLSRGQKGDLAEAQRALTDARKAGNKERMQRAQRMIDRITASAGGK
jgi:hypothetical protein